VEVDVERNQVAVDDVGFEFARGFEEGVGVEHEAADDQAFLGHREPGGLEPDVQRQEVVFEGGERS